MNEARELILAKCRQGQSRFDLSNRCRDALDVASAMVANNKRYGDGLLTLEAACSICERQNSEAAQMRATTQEAEVRLLKWTDVVAKLEAEQAIST